MSRCARFPSLLVRVCVAAALVVHYLLLAIMGNMAQGVVSIVFFVYAMIAEHTYAISRPRMHAPMDAHARKARCQGAHLPGQRTFLDRICDWPSRVCSVDFVQHLSLNFFIAATAFNAVLLPLPIGLLLCEMRWELSVDKRSVRHLDTELHPRPATIHCDQTPNCALVIACQYCVGNNSGPDVAGSIFRCVYVFMRA